MDKTTVIEHFGGVHRTARALHISAQAVSKWPSTIPIGRAYQIQAITSGKLIVDPAVYHGPDKIKRRA